MAPIAYRWLDAAHITYGVATAGLFTRTSREEGSTSHSRRLAATAGLWASTVTWGSGVFVTLRPAAMP